MPRLTTPTKHVSVNLASLSAGKVEQHLDYSTYPGLPDKGLSIVRYLISEFVVADTHEYLTGAVDRSRAMWSVIPFEKFSGFPRMHQPSSGSHSLLVCYPFCLGIKSMDNRCITFIRNRRP